MTFMKVIAAGVRAGRAERGGEGSSVVLRRPTLGITVYGACYLALTQRLDVPFLMADQKLE